MDGLGNYEGEKERRGPVGFCCIVENKSKISCKCAIVFKISFLSGIAFIAVVTTISLRILL